LPVEWLSHGDDGGVALTAPIWSLPDMDRTPVKSSRREAAPYGAYAPSPWQARVIAYTRSLPEGWFAKRIAFVLRRIVITLLRRPLDVEVFGQRMRLSPFNNVCEKRILFTPQYFDPAERGVLGERITEDMVFVDVGANVGAYALFVAARAGERARILAIEPQPIIFERLAFNIAQNPGAMIKAIGCALADREGEITLFVDSHNRGESSVKILGWTGETGQSVQVPAHTLLALVRQEKLERIDALKIDVEGAEDLVLAPFLRDAPESLLPGLVIIENARARWETDCIALFEAKGYRTVLETKLNVVMERSDQPEKATGRDNEMAASEISQP
jgi:FkbM family methyltransferase